jgi:hypothetical protein
VSDARRTDDQRRLPLPTMCVRAQLPGQLRTATTDQDLLQLPERVTVAVAELAGAAREGLLALAVGTGLQAPGHAG